MNRDNTGRFATVNKIKDNQNMSTKNNVNNVKNNVKTTTAEFLTKVDKEIQALYDRVEKNYTEKHKLKEEANKLTERIVQESQAKKKETYLNNIKTMKLNSLEDADRWFELYVMFANNLGNAEEVYDIAEATRLADYSMNEYYKRAYGTPWFPVK